MVVLAMLDELTGAAPDLIRIRAAQLLNAFLDEYGPSKDTTP